MYHIYQIIFVKQSWQDDSNEYQISNEIRSILLQIRALLEIFNVGICQLYFLSTTKTTNFKHHFKHCYYIQYITSFHWPKGDTSFESSWSTLYVLCNHTACSSFSFFASYLDIPLTTIYYYYHCLDTWIQLSHQHFRSVLINNYLLVVHTFDIN